MQVFKGKKCLLFTRMERGWRAFMCKVYLSNFVHGRITDFCDDISWRSVQRKTMIYV